MILSPHFVNIQVNKSKAGGYFPPTFLSSVAKYENMNNFSLTFSLLYNIIVERCKAIKLYRKGKMNVQKS